MRFIDALNLIQLCVEQEILQTVDGQVAVYRNGTHRCPEGWYLMSDHDLAQKLMSDPKGINALTTELQKRNIPLPFDTH